jgi:hypothetical protein
MKAIPYLFFHGACAEALAFYRDTIGAQIRALVRFRDMPGASPDTGDRVMHAELGVGESTIFAFRRARQRRPKFGLCDLSAGGRRCRGRTAVRGARRQGSDQCPLDVDPVCLALRHVERPLRHAVDDYDAANGDGMTGRVRHASGSHLGRRSRSKKER